MSFIKLALVGVDCVVVGEVPVAARRVLVGPAMVLAAEASRVVDCTTREVVGVVTEVVILTFSVVVVGAGAG